MATAEEGFRREGLISDPLGIDAAALRDLVAEYTGAERAAVSRDAGFGDIGLDSIAAVQLAHELLNRFTCEIHPDELFGTSLNTLAEYLQESGSRAASTHVIAQSARKLDHTNPASGDRPSIQRGGTQSEPRLKLHRIVAGVSGVPVEQIDDTQTLVELGVDSFSILELETQLGAAYSVPFANGQPDPTWTVQDLVEFVRVDDSHRSRAPSYRGIEQDKTGASDPAAEPQRQDGHSHHGVEQDKATESGSIAEPQQHNGPWTNPFEALANSDTMFEDAAQKSGFLGYWDEVAPLQNDLLLAYIVEAFLSLGVDLSEFPHGTEPPPVPHLPKYDRLMKRLLDILESRYVVIQRGGKVLRGSDRIDVGASAELCAALRTEHPAFACEATLMGLIGPKLAECISGKTNPVSVLFGSAASLQIMEDFYSNAPMMSALTDQLVAFLLALLRTTDASPARPIRILEVGAGTGGTTARLAEALAGAGIAVQYTFTDIGPAFVSKARTRFARYAWMDFALLNLEDEITDAFRGQYDLVLGANVVHATSDRTSACRRLRATLRPAGCVVLSEVTRCIDWYDICFGLLDGWWLAEGGKGYPIQPAEAWMDTLDRAGFASVGFSTGPSEEANTQQLLVACNREWAVPRSATA